MKLSKRLETIASFVPEGSTVADIGTDHGYIPIYLVQENKVKHAIAMDVRKGPLFRAQTHIKEAGLEDRIEVRLSDGLLKLEKGEADCVVIAGMGGELMIHILEEGRHLWDSISSWVLSPQSDVYKVRKFLHQESFFMEQECMMKEDGKYYLVMRVGRIEKKEEKELPDFHYRYGVHLLKNGDPLLTEYLEKEKEQIERILKDLHSGNTESAKQRIIELNMELEWIREAQDAMQRTH